MFGTVGRARINPENKERFVEVLRSQPTDVPGFRNAYVMFPENREGEVILVAMFEDADTYWKNADDPAQHQRYLEYRALLEDEPEWSDGEWFGTP
jgi:heme-degrading monooxygenase HmoA